MARRTPCAHVGLSRRFLAIVPTASPTIPKAWRARNEIAYAIRPTSPILDTRYQIEQMTATFAEHYNEQDVAALASMFTKDAARVASAATAISTGPQGIEEAFKTQFEFGFNHIKELTVDQVSPFGTDAAITIGKYRLTGQGRSSPLKIDGHWTEVEVREGGVWKIRLLTATPKTAPNAVTPSMEANAARPLSLNLRGQAQQASSLISTKPTKQ